MNMAINTTVLHLTERDPKGGSGQDKSPFRARIL